MQCAASSSKTSQFSKTVREQVSLSCLWAKQQVQSAGRPSKRLFASSENLPALLTVFGTMALDTTRTPFRTETRILGGAATFAALAASALTKTSMVAAIGDDMPSSNISALQKKGIDTAGIVAIKGGRCFHYDSSFDYDLSNRTTLKTELNVIANFDPVIPV